MYFVKFCFDRVNMGVTEIDSDFFFFFNQMSFLSFNSGDRRVYKKKKISHILTKKMLKKTYHPRLSLLSSVFTFSLCD